MGIFINIERGKIMSDALISIIIPVYNVEQYLYKCLQSVVNQTYKNLEIICVNDGSTDNSINILEEFAQKDTRVRIITQKNGGLSNARNTGIDNAAGDYIMFLDSDDWCDIYTVEKLYKNILENNTDFSICASVLFDDETKKYKTDSYFAMSYLSGFTNKRLNFNNINKRFFNLPVMAWGKLIRTNIIKDNNLRFIEDVAFEDNPFFMDLFFASKNFSILMDELIYYRINRNGSDTQSQGEKYFDFIKHWEYKKNKLQKYNKFEEIKDEYWNTTINAFYQRFSQIKDELKADFYNKFVEFLKRNYVIGTNKYIDRFVKKVTLEKLLNTEVKKNTFYQNIFSLRNMYGKKIITIFGIKIKLKRGDLLNGH